MRTIWCEDTLGDQRSQDCTCLSLEAALHGKLPMLTAVQLVQSEQQAAALVPGPGVANWWQKLEQQAS